jgi:hypothetical protein
MAPFCFQGTRFPQMGKLVWVKTILESRTILWKLVKEGFGGQSAVLPAGTG